MKKSKFTEAQIAFALRQFETGTRVEEICRQLGVSQLHFLIGRKSIVDNCSKICHSLLVGKSLKGADVVAELSKACPIEVCFPQRIQCDNGSEFISKEVDIWAYQNKVTLDFSRPGKSTDNPYVESFNGKFRDECLSVNWFLSLDDAREKTENDRGEYNHFRPHNSWMT